MHCKILRNKTQEIKQLHIGPKKNEIGTYIKCSLDIDIVLYTCVHNLSSL